MECPKQVDSKGYIELLNASQVFRTLDAKFGKGKYFFMQDGAPCHTAEATVSWISGQAKILPGWPANSPDLNPIEMIWGIVKKKLNELSDVTVAKIRDTVERTWNSIAEETINQLVASMQSRLEMVIAVNGNTISSYLSSHIPRVLPGTTNTAVMPPFFVEETDKQLWQLFSLHGRRWKFIAEAMGNVWSAVVIQHRIETLHQRRRNSKHDSIVETPFTIPLTWFQQQEPGGDEPLIKE